MSPTDTTNTARDAGRSTSRLLRATVLTVVSAVCAAGMAVLSSAAPASAAGAASAHDPIGSTPKFAAAPGGLRITGWAADPDDRDANMKVSAYIDGVDSLGSTMTQYTDAAASAKFDLGPTPRYALTVKVPSGIHTVCLVTANVGRGMRTINGCVATPLGTRLTDAQKAKHNPVGKLTTAYASSRSIRLAGWSTDPDLVNRRTLVVAYVDGQPASTVATTEYPGTRPAKAGLMSKFDITVPTSVATHIACIWLVNAGIGTNTHLGCKALDNRSPNNRVPALTQAPALNAQVVALAKKQIGKPYVWGATGPRSFDCSGLVMWGYGKYGYQTPRVSQDQIKAARLIPASHARPGDLVFYHDSVGDVYHVGIYLKPGLSVAAISTDRGVDYQQIWDSTATYGSFTHT